MSRRERKKIELEQRIRRAAAELFHAKGYEETTVDEIAEAADIAKATLFNYFPRKDALLLAVWEDTHERVLAELGPPEGWGETGPERLRRLFGAFAGVMEENPRLSRLILIEAMRSFWTGLEHSPLERHVREVVERMVSESQARGELTEGTDPRVAAALLRGVFGMTVVEWLREEAAGVTLQGELDAKFDVVFRGLGAVDVAGKGIRSQ